jgi:hypothetical protein
LEKVAKQEAEEINAANQVMETVVEEIINSDGQKQLVTTIRPTLDSTGERTFQYDIMISYCHADKELTYKIHKFLLHKGFKVWIDLDNMYGPGKKDSKYIIRLNSICILAMNAMADAVENSEFVIMCMSDSYKQSTYCQAEAEYAFKCKRCLIPLIMREGYKPDGWLGFMIGSRIYVDFGRYDFKTACEKLMTEISHHRKRPLPLSSKPDQMTQHELPTKKISNHQQRQASHRKKSLVTYDNHAFSVYTRRQPMSNFIRKPPNQWTESDVLDFLFTQHLIQLMPLCEAMDGRALIQLYKMGISRSSETYSLLDDELKSTYKMKLPLRIYTRFLSAIEQRLTTRPPTPVQTKSKLSLPAVTSFPQRYVSHSATATITSFPQEGVSSPPRTTVTSSPQGYASYPPKTTITSFPPGYVSSPPRTTITSSPQGYASYPPKTTVTSFPQGYASHPPRTTVTSSPQGYVSYPSRTSVINDVSSLYFSYPDKPYDLFITSDAPALELLRAVERYGPNPAQISSVLTKYRVRF